MPKKCGKKQSLRELKAERGSEEQEDQQTRRNATQKEEESSHKSGNVVLIS